MFISREFAGTPPSVYTHIQIVLGHPYLHNLSASHRLIEIKRRLEEAQAQVPLDRQIRDRAKFPDYKRRHDVESLFWVFIFFVSRAWPASEEHGSNGDTREQV